MYFHSQIMTFYSQHFTFCWKCRNVWSVTFAYSMVTQKSLHSFLKHQFEHRLRTGTISNVPVRRWHQKLHKPQTCLLIAYTLNFVRLIFFFCRCSCFESWFLCEQKSEHLEIRLLCSPVFFQDERGRGKPCSCCLSQRHSTRKLLIYFRNYKSTEKDMMVTWRERQNEGSKTFKFWSIYL